MLCVSGGPAAPTESMSLPLDVCTLDERFIQGKKLKKKTYYVIEKGRKHGEGKTFD